MDDNDEFIEDDLVDSTDDSDDESCKFVDSHFSGRLTRLNEIKSSSARVPKETQNAIDREYECLRKAIRAVRQGLRGKLTELSRLQAVEKEYAQLQNELAATQRAQAATVRNMEHLHAQAGPDSVIVKIPRNGGEAFDEISCNRAIMKHWSPAIAALLRHGNGLQNGSPLEVTLADTDISTFKSVLQFKAAGRLLEGVVSHLCPNQEEAQHKKDGEEKQAAQEHDLLRFADMYGLDDLRAEYFHQLKERTPLVADTAAKYLELALRYNANAIRDEAADLIARKVESSSIPPVFFELSAVGAACVLAQESLVLKDEKDIFNTVSKWAEQHPSRKGQVAQLLQSVRFELISLKDLVDMQETLLANTAFAEVKGEITKAISNAVQGKLAQTVTDESIVSRKRRHSIVDKSQDESYLKVARYMQGLQHNAAGA